MSILPYLNGARFDDKQVEAMSRAFKEATVEMRVQPSVPPIVRRVIAARIIEAAKHGQRDPHQLCKLALKDLRA
jgi:hypothetical protein